MTNIVEVDSSENHVTSHTLEQFKKLLNQDGVFLKETPNGTILACDHHCFGEKQNGENAISIYFGRNNVLTPDMPNNTWNGKALKNLVNAWYMQHFTLTEYGLQIKLRWEELPVEPELGPKFALKKHDFQQTPMVVAIGEEDPRYFHIIHGLWGALNTKAA